LGKTADGVADALIEHTTVLPAMFAKSLTWDQSSELARHAQVTTATQMAIYFAHPHSPWERGSNENTNRMIRRYLPKSTLITDHQPYLTAIAEELNEIPRKCLNWRTPREAYDALQTRTVTPPRANRKRQHVKCSLEPK
jgi:transposase, IS30 family